MAQLSPFMKFCNTPLYCIQQQQQQQEVYSAAMEQAQAIQGIAMIRIYNEDS